MSKIELDAYKQALEVLRVAAKREDKLAEIFKDNKESFDYHTRKSLHFMQAVKIIEFNVKIFLDANEKQ